LMTLLAACATGSDVRPADKHHLEVPATTMEVSNDSVTSPDLVADASPRVTDSDYQTVTGSSLLAPEEPTGSSSPTSVAKVPVLSFSVAAIMAKPGSPPASRTKPEIVNHNHFRARHRRRDSPPLSPRRTSAFTVDGILNGRDRNSADDADDSSCSADSESNRSSPVQSPLTTANASAVRQNLPFLHPGGATLDVTCKWPPSPCPYPWQYPHPPSEYLLYIL